MIFGKNVDGILAALTNTVKQLESHSDKMGNKAAMHASKAATHNAHEANARVEQDRAKTAARKIGSLLA